MGGRGHRRQGRSEISSWTDHSCSVRAADESRQNRRVIGLGGVGGSAPQWAHEGSRWFGTSFAGSETQFLQHLKVEVPYLANGNILAKSQFQINNDQTFGV